MDVITFHGDQLEVVRMENQRIGLVLRRLCENLGLNFSRQFQKLKDSGWATICKMHTVGLDGKLREQTILDAESIPMWMATLKEGKVSPELLPKIRVYQLECKDVLYKHFTGQDTPNHVGDIFGAMEKAIRPFEETVRGLNTAVEIMVARVEKVENSNMQLLGLLNELMDHQRRMLSEQRKELSATTKDRHIKAIGHYGGLCPCCSKKRIVENGKRVPRVAQFDHFFLRSMNQVWKTWMVCSKCNSELRGSRQKDGKFWLNAVQPFGVYHQRRIAFESGVQRLLFDERDFFGLS